MSSTSSTTATVLWEHVQAADLCPGSKTLDDWLNVRWFRVRIRSWAVPMLPVLGWHKPLILHDIHHVVTGYDTTNVGEIEIAAWEIASGGCGWSLFFWLIQIGAMLLGLLVCPRRTVAAFRAGWQEHNLYGLDPDQVLAMEFDQVLRVVRGIA